MTQLPSETERLAVIEKRARIARDLHDHVIQRLLGIGRSTRSPT